MRCNYIITNDYDFDFKLLRNGGDFSLEYLLEDYIVEFLREKNCKIVSEDVLIDSARQRKILIQTDNGITATFSINENILPSKWDEYRI